MTSLSRDSKTNGDWRKRTPFLVRMSTYALLVTRVFNLCLILVFFRELDDGIMKVFEQLGLHFCFPEITGNASPKDSLTEDV